MTAQTPALAPAPMDESERLSTIIALQHHLEVHERGTDLLLSSMAAAARCTRRHSVCTPFPKELYTAAGCEKDLQGLCNDLLALPAAAQLRDFGRLSNLEDRVLQLLRWLLLRSTRRRVLHAEPAAQLHQLLQGSRCSGWEKLFSCAWMRPSAVFRLEQSGDHALHDPVLAFHGTSFENLYSILQNGLLNLTGTLLQRTGANYGDGIYLSTDLDVAFHFSLPGRAWDSSCLGNKLRALLVCQVDRSYLADAGQLHNLHPGQAGAAAAAGRPGGGGAGLPSTYLLVKSKAAVSISHIVVWNDQPGMHASKARRVNWCAVLVALYALMMLALGMRRSGVRWHGH